MEYLDFDLTIDSIDVATARYHVRVDSPEGKTTRQFVLPFSALELENVLLKLGRPRRSVRGIHTAEGKAARDFGEQLYTAIFQGPVQSCLERSLDTAARQKRGLRLRLHLDPNVIDLPWEYLFDPSHNHFFAYSEKTPLVRYVDLPRHVTALLVKLPQSAGDDCQPSR